MRIFSIWQVILVAFVIAFTFSESYAQTATYNIMVNVTGNCVLTDASQDDATGINPTLTQTISLSADVGSSDIDDSSDFRVRTNENSWTLANMFNSGSAGMSMLTVNSIFYTFTQMAGSNAVAGVFSAPYPGPVNLLQFFSNMTIATGAQKTSMARGTPIGSNTNNYVQFGATTSIPNDFFYEEDVSPFVNVQYDFTAP